MKELRINRRQLNRIRPITEMLLSGTSYNPPEADAVYKVGDPVIYTKICDMTYEDRIKDRPGIVLKAENDDFMCIVLFGHEKFEMFEDELELIAF